MLTNTVVQPLHLRDRLVRHIAAQLAYVHRKALGIAWVLCQPVEMLYMHATTRCLSHKQMAGDFVRTIGHARARLKLGLINMAYNMKRWSYLEEAAA